MQFYIIHFRDNWIFKLKKIIKHFIKSIKICIKYIGTNKPSLDLYNKILYLQKCTCAEKPKCPPCPELYNAVNEISKREVIIISKN